MPGDFENHKHEERGAQSPAKEPDEERGTGSSNDRCQDKGRSYHMSY